MTTIRNLLNAGTNLKPHSLNKSPDLGEQDTIVADFVFNDNGTKMFVVGNNTGRIYEYTLGTAYDVTTASHIISIPVYNQDDNPSGIAFNNDGTKMFVVGNKNDSIYEYTLTTGFSLATASYSTNSFSVNTQDNAPSGIAFNNDGTKMFITGDEYAKVYEYALGAAYDVTSAIYSNNSFSVAQDNSPQGLAFNSDGTNMVIIGI